MSDSKSTSLGEMTGTQYGNNIVLLALLVWQNASTVGISVITLSQESLCKSKYLQICTILLWKQWNVVLETVK